ncbi:MAG: hypothetical protein AB9880_01480 [Christensenellales bacterium]
MDFSGKVFLASIQEDNTQRSLFRVRPLLDAQGPVSQEDLDSIGDEGFMRVVPDKQEQYTFKERMRTLGDMCLIDLRHIDAQSHKVRANKNYAPQKGEINRFVIYSDAIQSVHSLPICEVVSDPKAPVPVTSCYYLRSGGHIEGPYDRELGKPVEALSCIAPDSDRLFAVTMTDERERLFFWPESPLAAEAEHNEQAEPSPDGGLDSTPPAPEPPEGSTDEPEDRVLAALRQEVEGLQAQRLELLTSLAQLHTDREHLLREAAALEAAEDEGHDRREQAARASISLLSLQLEALAKQREALLGDAALAPLRLAAPGFGQDHELAEAAGAVTDAMAGAGFLFEEADAMNLLLHALLFPVVRVAAPYLGDAELAIEVFCDAIGARRLSPQALEDTKFLPGGDLPVFLVTTTTLSAHSAFTQLLPGSLLKPAFDNREGHRMQPWPLLPLRTAGDIAQSEPSRGIAVKADQLRAQALGAARDLPEAALELLRLVDAALAANGHTLPLAQRRSMLLYLRCAQSLLDGGIVAALDFALCCWVLPFMRMYRMDTRLLLPFLGALPRTQATL